MNTSSALPKAQRLAVIIDALARRFGAGGVRESAAGDEGWLGWDAWVRVSGELHETSSR